MNRTLRRCRSRSTLTVVVGLMSGCSLGPAMLRTTRTGYNDAIQQTTSEQLLLNLVRLKYRDQPFFLEVSSVSAQFQFDRSASVSGKLNENVGTNPINPDVLQMDGRFAFSDRPTVTLTPLQGDMFATRMLEPVGLNTILLLIRSGWSADRVLRLTVQQMNGRDNASRASGPTPERAAAYRRFAKVSALWRDLSWSNLMHIGLESRRTRLSPPIPAASVRAADLVAAAREGLKMEPSADKPDSYVVTGPSLSPVMHIARRGGEDPRWKEFAQTLGLDPQATSFTLQTSSAMPTAGADDEGRLHRILIAPRSLMGTLFYLSHAIEVPQAHAQAKLVTETKDASGQAFNWSEVTGDLLRVHSQRNKPSHAAVAIRHRGYWFFIDDDDLASKSTFTLLGQLFALRAGEIQGTGPQLTLPVGG